MIRAAVGLVVAAICWGFTVGMIVISEPLLALLGGIVGSLALVAAFLMWMDYQAEKFINTWDEFVDKTVEEFKNGNQR